MTRTLVLILSLSAAPALADSPASKCRVSLKAARLTAERVVTQSSDASYREVEGDEALKIVAALNAVPPVTRVVADRVIVLDLGGDVSSYVVGLALRGCVNYSHPIPRDQWDALTKQATGDRT